jgi:hypothetical protein
MIPEQAYRIIRNMENRNAIKSWFRRNVPVYMGRPLERVYIQHTKMKVSDMTIKLTFENVFGTHVFGIFFNTDDNDKYPIMGLHKLYGDLESNFYSFLRGLDRKRKITMI